MQNIPAKPLSVLFVDPAPFMGGAQASLLTLMVEMAHEGHRLTLACASPELARQARQESIPCQVFSCRHWPATLSGCCQFLADRHRLRRFLGKLIQDLQPDLVHLNTLRAGLIAPRLSCPMVIHDRDLKGPALIPRLLAWRHPAVIAISQPVADKWSGLKLNLRVIPNPVQLPPDLPDITPPDSPFTVALIADLVPWKNHPLFIQAIAELHQRCPDLKAVIKGRLRSPKDQTYLDELQTLSQQLGLNDILTVDTRQQSAWDTIQRAHVIVSTALNEPFGRTVIEALALGKPVVALDSGGLHELLSHCPAATLIPPAPTDTRSSRLADAIAAWQSPEARHSARQQAMTFAQAFSTATVAPQVLQFYRTLTTLP